LADESTPSQHVSDSAGQTARSELSGADFLEEQHDFDSDPRAALGGASAIPLRSEALMATTQEPQWAEPALTAFAAAIHCESENRAIGGGITPRSSAQTSRSWGVLQQHDVQQSAACEHPQPPSWQGNASPDAESPPSSLARVAERTAWDGITPVPAMQNAASSTHASARRAVERGLCNSKRIETISVAVAADGSRIRGGIHQN
jgi:hypothetical protein